MMLFVHLDAAELCFHCLGDVEAPLSGWTLLTRLVTTSRCPTKCNISNWKKKELNWKRICTEAVAAYPSLWQLYTPSLWRDEVQRSINHRGEIARHDARCAYVCDQRAGQYTFHTSTDRRCRSVSFGFDQSLVEIFRLTHLATSWLRDFILGPRCALIVNATSADRCVGVLIWRLSIFSSPRGQWFAERLPMEYLREVLIWRFA